MKSKKSFGQNFLVNKNAARRIASLLRLTPDDQVLEIGGGRGDLTVHLLRSGAMIHTVELDHQLTEYLRARFEEFKNFNLIESDILEIDPQREFAPNTCFKLIGNIPYNISSPILEWMITHRAYFPEAVLTMQKEVADRVIAKAGNKQFGSLSVFVQLFYQPAKAFILKPGSFFPPPKVTSSVIQLKRLKQSLIEDSEYPGLRRLIAACFRWRRKQMLRILREEYDLRKPAGEQILGELSIPTATRPEQLTVETFVALARILECRLSDSS